MPEKRIAFFGIAGHSRHAFAGSFPGIDGMPRSAGVGLDNALECYVATDNKGNMIHGEAPARILQCNRNRSCYVSLGLLTKGLGWSPERVGEEIGANFDLFVYSTANAIRPNFDPGPIADILRTLRCDFVVLGMGMQKSLPPTKEGLHENLVALLEVCDQKAALFGVRGFETEAWLKSVGYKRASALGCPSMYAYPRNVLNIEAPDMAKLRRAVTGGYIHGRVPRSTALIKLFSGFECHYIMQEELHILRQNGLLVDSRDIYNDATGEVSKRDIVPVLQHIHRRELPFASYRWFQDPSAWRAFVSHFDFYLGDRLHGGIVALQTGIPAALMAADRRVAEIADFFAIPQLSVQQATDVPVLDIVATLLSSPNISAMKDAYSQRLRGFQAVFKQLDIPLTLTDHSIGAGASDRLPPRRLPPPTPMRRLKDWLGERIA